MAELDPADEVGPAADAEAAEVEGVDAEVDRAESPLAPGENDLADAWWAM